MSVASGGFNRSVSRLPSPAPWAEAPLLLLTACDQSYLPHALALVRSLDALSPGVHVMLHLLNPDEASLALVEKQAREVEATRLYLSTENIALPAGASETAYFASARFLRMAELLERRNAPVLALDADALAVGPVTLDFSDKPETEVCLRQREVADPDSRHLSVAAGAVWARSTPRSRAFFRAVADDLIEAFANGSATWFVDQQVLARHVDAGTADAKVRNLKTKFADWEFGDDAVFWMGKGDRKYLDVRYLMLRDGFDPDPLRRAAGCAMQARLQALLPQALSSAVTARALAHFARTRRTQVGIFLPRLDMPWKRQGLRADGQLPALSADTLELRLWWKRFAMALAAACTDAGAEVRIVEIPAWEITAERVDAEGLDVAFVPHRTADEFGPTRTARRFYMQQYLRSAFVVDPLGWGPASSIYPVDAGSLPPAVLGAWDDCRARYEAGTLESKFAQSERTPSDRLRATGQLPDGPYAFLPLQIPHDQSLRMFSDVGMEAAFDAAVSFAAAAGLTLVVKGHPANAQSMQALRERHGEAPVFWSRAHVHDLLEAATGVVTVNSGVGFEALIADRPVVCLGRAEYDAVVHRATPDTLAEAWGLAVSEPDAARRQRYARFVDWFLGRHSVDLARPATCAPVLRRHVRMALQEACARREATASDATGLS